MKEQADIIIQQVALERLNENDRQSLMDRLGGLGLTLSIATNEMIVRSKTFEDLEIGESMVAANGTRVTRQTGLLIDLLDPEAIEEITESYRTPAKRSSSHRG